MLHEKEVTSVLIVSGSQKATDYLKELMSPEQFTPVAVAQNAGEARRRMVEINYDIVIINTPLSDEFGSELACELCEKSGCGVLLFVKNEIFEQVTYKVEDFGILTLSRPCQRQTVFQSLKLLVATSGKLRSYREKAQTLESKMEEIRLVNRAKLLLISQLKMSEAEAHRYIEKAAMDSCVKRSEIAQSIIRTYEY